jgi:hypothetical protein
MKSLPSLFTYFALLIFPGLYAETHYRLKYFFSWLRKSEPEIIVDIPSRIHKGITLPVLIIIKDAHLYPVTLLQVSIWNKMQVIDQRSPNVMVNTPYKEIILEIDTKHLPIGKNFLDVHIWYRVKNKIKTCKNDNHRGTSHDALPIYISDSALPRLSHCLYGETHSHTFYTSDQVEFGASIQATAKLAKAMGLDFYCATDHSYDLDDHPDNYLGIDPELKKWHLLQQEVAAFNNNNSDFTILAGEEVTVRNNQDKNVHCLIYNSKMFFPGSGDGAERWLHNRSEMSLEQLLSAVSKDALVFAAHPTVKPPLLQKVLLNRGHWQIRDCLNRRLNGLQFINNGGLKEVEKGKKFWIALLLRGFRLIAIAGNDAHGNFARFRQIGFPFFTMRENYKHLFGKWRTGIYSKNKYNSSDILNALKQGQSFMTNGPALSLMALVNRKWLPMGGTYKNITKLKVEVESTVEFSKISRVIIYSGYIGNKNEQIVLDIGKFEDKLYHVFELDFKAKLKDGYVRVEVYTSDGSQALSNPIWFSK